MKKKSSKSKIDVVIDLLRDIRDNISEIRDDNSKILKLKTRQLIFEKKIADDFLGEDINEDTKNDKVD